MRLASESISDDAAKNEILCSLTKPQERILP